MSNPSHDPSDGKYPPLPYPPNRLAWSTWAIAMTLFLTAFYHRVAPAVMTSELMADFRIGATGLGNLSAFYYYLNPAPT